MKKNFHLGPILVVLREISLSLEPVKVASGLWSSLKLRQYQLRWTLTSLRYLRKIAAVAVFRLVWDGLGWRLITVLSLISFGLSNYWQFRFLLSFFVGVTSGRVFSFNKGINFVKVFKKGLLTYIDDNALIVDYGGSFSETVKNCLHK